MDYFELSIDLVLLMLLMAVIAFFVVLSFYGLTIPVLIDLGLKALRNLPRDIRAGINFLRLTIFIQKSKYFDRSVDQLFLKTVEQCPDKIAIYYKNEKWSFQTLHQYSNQVANCFTELGYKQNDQVCLMMSNRPEYIGIWLGLAKIGVIPGLVNTNVKNDFLLHVICAIDCKAIIFENKYYDTIAEIIPQLTQTKPLIKFYCFGDSDDVNNNPMDGFLCEPIHKMIDSYGTSKDFLLNQTVRTHFDSILFYMYTSGTTGYSKAAIFRHYRYISLGTGMGYMLGLKKDDILYLSLPLYHANSCVSTCLALVHGMSVALKDKFSATDFWNDCIQYKCTVANYIGEVCRYLLAQPVRDCDRKHNLRVMFGNGLRPKIWSDFKERFNIPLIGEFYSSTEGNASTINCFGREGACGFYPYYYGIFIRLFYPLVVLKVDPITGDIIRNKKGLCIPVSPGQVGEIAARIRESNVLTRFEGYTDECETNKKIIKNVFSIGDRAFLSGDLVRIDSNGWLTFIDRTGDTYRWKGENVSTADVEAVIQKVTQLSDCIVFGVDVFGCEGKAGMVVIAADKDTINLDQLAEDLGRQLPTYAIPIFLRLTKHIEMTGSYKLVKNSYVKCGYCPESTTDPLYFYDSYNTKRYIHLNRQLYEDITSGRMRI